MGTEYHVSWVSSTESLADSNLERQKVKSGVDALLIDINKSMSTYDPESELSLINSNFDPNWQPISADLYRVLAMAMQVGKLSDGAFDVTVGPLVNLWGFGPDKRLEQAPDTVVINKALQSVGSEAISLRHKNEVFELKLKASRYIDLSAIAKGYAVDLVGRYLEDQNIQNYLVEIGGEIYAKGTKSALLGHSKERKTDIDKPWRIAIEAPSDDERNAQIIIPLSDMGIATSGDYRNFFKQNGHRFSHTIDGRTGYPVEHGLASVSVLHESVAMADAWATALTVLGTEKGLEIAEQQGLVAFFIQRTATGFEQYSSSQFEQLRLNSTQ